MALQYSTTLRDNQINQIESTIGTAPQLLIKTGTPPANCAAADTGTTLATITLPSDWFNASSNGSATILGGPWTDPSADNSGTAGYFRLKNAAGTVTHMQGTVGTSAADMIVDSVSFTQGQSFSINSFTITAGNP